MSTDTRPRRFFGLLCAHLWEHVGERTRTFQSGETRIQPILQCKHCGDMKVVRHTR